MDILNVVGLIDVPAPLSEHGHVRRADPRFRLKRLERFVEAESRTTTQVVRPADCVSHVDSPWHVIDRGGRLDQNPDDDASLYDPTDLFLEVDGGDGAPARVILAPM